MVLQMICGTSGGWLAYGGEQRPRIGAMISSVRNVFSAVGGV